MPSRADATLTPSAITLGTSGLGDRADAVATARALLRTEHAMIDTSNAYDGGRSEQVIGRAIADLGGLPAHVQVISKADRDLGTGTFDRDRVLRSFEESTSRLGLDSLPLYQLHDPYTITVAEAMAPGGAVQGLVELREQGAVGAIGVAAGPSALLTAYLETGAFDAVLSHNRFTLVDRSAADLFDRARRRGIVVFNAAPFGGGMLADGARSGARYAYRDAPAELLAWVQRADEVCARHRVPLAAAALAFSTRQVMISSTVVGLGSQARLTELAALLATPIPEDLWPALDALGPPPSPLTD
ncbi:aldo/keto reductase [Ruania zhangjianzhongii]|uniref:aldo/keto reductase n=1 Tax=Ruania zhangjianzhongii TaxID=2603206 RepID=UPI0011C9A715|nr:aldo/keto reductase [Ruania zhangjianzhongii]